jgi:aryl-alcohol dehydrogenase-like predicted oxidoreductase
MNITTIRGEQTSPLGLAAYPEQDPSCAELAARSGINFFFFYSPSSTPFVDALRSIAKTKRDDIILAGGAGARSKTGLQAARRKIFAAVDAEVLDIFFAEYIHPDDDSTKVFGRSGALDELQRWKADGAIRYVGATAHDRKLAKQLAEDPRVDILMHRFNMAHRKAADEVFPAALRSQTPVIAFTATRWGTLLKPHAQIAADVPSAADCYRFCLAQPAIHLVLTAPKTVAELNENLAALNSPPMSEEVLRRWEQFGDAIYKIGGRSAHDFESQWP